MTAKCANPACGHASSRHNSLGYCRSKTTANRSGECACECFERPRESKPTRRMSELGRRYSIGPGGILLYDPAALTPETTP